MTTECVKCDKPMPEKNDGWVECSCSAHTGWYCDSCSPGNDCYDDEECDCCNPLEEEFYEVSRAENPDVEYFNTLEEAKAFCDKHCDLDYGLIMLCDKHKKHIGDWGDYEEEEEEDEECEVCDTKTKTTIKSYGCMDMSVCKNCEEEVEEEEKPKCDYCDKESVVEWKAWSAILCRDCAIKINKGLKKLIDSCE